MSSDTDDVFVAHRSLLFTVAYELLGSAADAEDVVQETWLRWAEVERDTVRDARAYLVRIVTRQSLNRLRTLARRREDYIGDWLPEPLPTAPDVAEDVELAESVSTAMLIVLETLGQLERVVFVLREVFDVPYEEIATAVDKTPAAVRQIAHRAREHVAARRPRVRVQRAQQEAVAQRFMAATSDGQIEAMLELLAPDAVLITDGGGIAPAARTPIVGAQRLSRVLVKLAQPIRERMSVTPTAVNGGPGARVDVDGALDCSISFAFDGARITGVYIVRNPEKLGAMASADTVLTRRPTNRA